MSLTTYILTVAMVLAIYEKFEPDLLMALGGRSIFVLSFEIFILRIGFYILDTENKNGIFDIASYSGYKFVGIVITIVFSHLLKYGYTYLILSFISSVSMGIFMMKTLAKGTVGKRYLVFFMSLLQIPISFWMGYFYSFQYLNQ